HWSLSAGRWCRLAEPFGSEPVRIGPDRRIEMHCRTSDPDDIAGLALDPVDRARGQLAQHDRHGGLDAPRLGNNRRQVRHRPHQPGRRAQRLPELALDDGICKRRLTVRRYLRKEAVVDTTDLRAAYQSFLVTARKGRFGPPPSSEWTAPQLLAHIVAGDTAITSVALAVAAGQRPSYDNRPSLD